MNEEKINQEREAERAKWGKVVKVRFLNHFFDGTLMSEFEKVNQDGSHPGDPHVEKGEIRELSQALLNRVVQSGAQIERVFEPPMRAV